MWTTHLNYNTALQYSVTLRMDVISSYGIEIFFFFFFLSSSYWDLSSSESWRCFESGWVMNNASTQRALPLPVRSQAGWANMGQHLQRKPGSVEPRNIKARIGTHSRHSLCVESRLTSSPVREPLSSTLKTRLPQKLAVDNSLAAVH